MGRGRGFGRGFGRGRGWRWATGFPGWAGAGWGPPTYGYGYGAPYYAPHAAAPAYDPYGAAAYGSSAAPEEELAALKSQADYFANALEEVRKRIEEIESAQKQK